MAPPANSRLSLNVAILAIFLFPLLLPSRVDFDAIDCVNHIRNRLRIQVLQRELFVTGVPRRRRRARSSIETRRVGSTDLFAKDPCEQVYAYIDDILAGKVIGEDRQHVQVSEKTHFHCYILADITPQLRKLKAE